MVVCAILIAVDLTPTKITSASTNTKPTQQTSYAQRLNKGHAPTLSIEPYIRPSFAEQMRQLRPVILQAAQRHNRPEISHMTDQEFAAVIALILYNENFGSFEDRFASVRPLTPLYQQLQVEANEFSGSNFSVWPANLRPSVALEILRQEVPVPAPTTVITRPITVTGSKIDINSYQSEAELYAAITREINDPVLAVSYLAANLERGLYRAQYEGVPVTWRTLAAWHNQGIVSPKDIRRNPTARSYIYRSSAYIPSAYMLINGCESIRCKKGNGRQVK